MINGKTDRNTHTHAQTICSNGRYLCTAYMRRVVIMVTTDRSSSMRNFLNFLDFATLLFCFCTSLMHYITVHSASRPLSFLHYRPKCQCLCYKILTIVEYAANSLKQVTASLQQAANDLNMRNTNFA